jgi:hypothetical protein
MVSKNVEREVVTAEEVDVEEKEVLAKRVYTSNMTIDSDLFKLEASSMKKNVGIYDAAPMLIDVEHCHFYRTFDSNGKYMNKCNFVGGHTHEVKTSVSKDGLLSAECGSPIGSVAGDKHTHAIRYIKSDRVEKRRINDEAQKTIDMLSRP